MDVNISSVMTEGNKMLFLNFVRALLGQVNLGQMNTLDNNLLIEDVDALIQEENELVTVAKVVDKVLRSIFCPSAQECLEYSYAWEVTTASKSDEIQFLDTILKKWRESKMSMS